MATTETQTRALPTLHEFFAPGGILARSPLPYEYRPGQLEMAKAVERALQEHRHLIVEAGTGTGKTLAYLLPALRTGQRVIVSTGTKALQDQLYFRDVPFLETLLGGLRVCYMKGRANYLCRHKLVQLRDQPVLSGLEEIDQYRQIAEWEKTTETGDRAELGGMPESSALWNKLDARGEACLGQECPDYRRCFITEMRRRALESDIIIVNHHLFFADLAVKREAGGAPDAGILPEAAAVVFDEAHELEEVASSYFGLSVSNVRMEELAQGPGSGAARQGGRGGNSGADAAIARAHAAVFCRAARGSGWTAAIRESRRVSGRLRRSLRGHAGHAAAAGRRDGEPEGRGRGGADAQARGAAAGRARIPDGVKRPQRGVLAGAAGVWECGRRSDGGRASRPGPQKRGTGGTQSGMRGGGVADDVSAGHADRRFRAAARAGV